MAFECAEISVRMFRNQCSDKPDWVFECFRNRCSDKTGISVRMRPKYALIDGSNYQLSEFIDDLKEIDGEALVETKRNANKFITRNMLKEVFRVTQSFAKDNDLDGKMRNEDWYQYTRILVNTLSHSGLLDLDHEKNMRKNLPISYRSHQITEDMHGKPIKATLGLAYEIIESIIEWVNNI